MLLNAASLLVCLLLSVLCYPMLSRAVLCCGVIVSLRLQAKNQREGLSSERYLVLPSNVSSDPYTTLRYVTHSTRKHST